MAKARRKPPSDSSEWFEGAKAIPPHPVGRKAAKRCKRLSASQRAELDDLPSDTPNRVYASKELRDG